MIYISTSCVKHNNIKDSVEKLATNGFNNIELSGGTEFYNSFIDDLLDLQSKYQLNYICHNYFPPPKKHFVLNLASLNDEVYLKTFDHIVEAIELSKALGSKRYAFHAGFFIDIKLNEIGKKISKECLFDISTAENKFCDGYKILQNIAGNELELYIENNVYSSTNFKTYNGNDIFMLCDHSNYKSLKNKIDFNLLLDVAHLKVSSQSLGLSFEKQLINLISKTDYIHISDNDGLHDLNNKLNRNSNLLQLLRKQDLSNKILTLEVYDDMDAIKESYQLLEEII
jgi:sugar phosphate isomerase/epimerase